MKKIKLLSITGATGAFALFGMAGNSLIMSYKNLNSNVSLFVNLYNKENKAFWNSYKNINGGSQPINTVYQDYSKTKSMGEDPDNQNIGGPEYSGYSGIAGGDDSPYDYASIAKNSTAQNITFAFNVQNTTNDSRYGATNTYTVMQREGDTLTDPYWSQTSNAHSDGTSVDIGYGGDFTYATNTKENYWVMGNNNAASAKMLEDSILEFGTHQLDFDIESPTAASVNNIDNLMKQIGAVQRDLGLYNWNLGIRWTVMGMNTTYFDKSIKYGLKNFVVNPMINGSEMLANVQSDDQSFISQIRSDTNITSWLKGKSDKDINHYIGMTMWWGTDLNSDTGAIAVGNYFAKQEIGFLGYWSISSDHKKGSIEDRDPRHQCAANSKDYQFTNDIFNSYIMNSTWHDNKTITSKSVSNLSTNYITTSDVGIKWNPSAGAKYYEILDSSNNVIYKTPKTKFSFDATTEEYTNVNIQHNKSYQFNIVTVSANGQKSKPTNIKFNTSAKNLLPKEPYAYKNNMDYNTRKNYDSMGEYIFYNNDVYKIVSHATPGSKTPDKNSSFKKVDQYSGLSKDFIKELSGRVNSSHYSEFDFKKLALSNSSTMISKQFPNVNQYLYDKLHNRK